MKKFLLRSAALVLSLLFVLTVICVTVDPFNVFHVTCIRNNGVEPNKNYIKMSYILENPDKFNAFMFGSSHVGNIHTDRIPDVRCYNMTCSNGLPDEFLENLRTLLSAGIVPDKVYLGLDNLSYSATSDYLRDSPYRCPYEYSKTNPKEFWKMYLSPSTVGSALVEVIGGNDSPDDYFANFYTCGWNYDYGFARYEDPEGRTPEEMERLLSGRVDIPAQRMPYERAVETVRQMKELCDENGIKLTVFVTPFYFSQVADENYIGFLSALAEVTDYYNFAGYNSLCFDAANFVDMGHYNAETGDLMLECMAPGACPDSPCPEELSARGFGAYVTADNIAELIPVITGTVF